MRRKAGPLGDLGPLARACIVAGIRGTEPGHPSLVSLPEEAPLLMSEGLAGVAVRWFGESRPAFEDDAARTAFEQIRAVARAAEMRAMATDAACLPLVARLGASGFPVAVVKGPAVARFHPTGWPRPYSDLDVVLPVEYFERAVAVAVESGFAYPSAAIPPWPWVDRYCREGVNLHGPGNLDLHHHVPPWVFGAGLRSSDLVSRAEEVTLGGVTVKAAGRDDTAVVAALHVLNDLWKGRLGLASWRDLVVLLHDTPGDEIAEAFERTGTTWLLDLTTAALAESVPEANVASTGASSPARPVGWRLRVLGWDRTSFVTRHRGAWVARLPVGHAAAFLAASAVPSTSYIRSRHQSYPRYWWRALRETVWTLGGADLRSEARGAPSPGRSRASVSGRAAR